MLCDDDDDVDDHDFDLAIFLIRLFLPSSS